MKTTKLKALVIMLLILIGAMQLTSFAANEEFVTVEKDSNNYLIYIEEVLNKEFEFAFSNEADPVDLNYISSAKDTQGNNIAYVDEALKTQFFADNSAYLWVKTDEGANILNGVNVNLTLAKSETQLESMKNMTKTITIKADADDEKIIINGNKDEKYFYKMFSIGSSEEYQRLVNLVEGISQYDDKTNVYTKMQSYIELNELYDKLAPAIDDKNWVEAKDLQIEKPYDAKENQQYVLWLKDENGTRDFQILTAYQKTVKNVEVKENVVEVTSRLPVTYDDSAILYIALTVVVIAIIAMVIVKKKIASKSNKE